MTEVARTSKLLEDIFFFFFLVPISLFQKIVSFSNYYAFKEDIKSTTPIIRDGIERMKKHFIPCTNRDKTKTNKALDSNAPKFPITLGYVIAWIGIAVLDGALSNASGSMRRYCEEMLHGYIYPPIQNTMSRNVFEFMRRHIYWNDNQNYMEQKVNLEMIHCIK